MEKESSIKDEDNERIIDDFRSIRFPCIRCGSKNIEVIEADSHSDGINAQSVHSHSPTRDIELTFYVVGILFCRKCNHRFHVKILDQGIKNTNVYFDNTLT